MSAPIRWRVGHKVPINIYEGDDPGRPICQVHNEEDACRIVDAVNATFARHTWRAGTCIDCGAKFWGGGSDIDICPGRPE